MKKILIGIAILITVWCAFFFTDYSLAKANRHPIFAVPVLMCADGGSTEYCGIGYKVNVYVRIVPERDFDTETVRVDFGSWFMPDLYEQ